MADRSTEFFDALGRRGKEPVLEGVTGTIRFDLEHDQGIDHWFVSIIDGDIRVSREEREADTIARTTRALFDQFATGDKHIFAAFVRNEITLVGDVRLGRLFERVLPGPPGAHHPRAFALERRQRG